MKPSRSEIGSESHMAPQMCRSTNRRGSVLEPEICFRIVHVAQESQEGGPTAAYREQTVEIALGPKGAFENGNIGALTRQVPAERVVSAVPLSGVKPKPPKEPRTPRVVELLRNAIEWQALLESGEIANQVDIARREGITRARVTQVMGMLRLAPEIQQHILSLPEAVHRPASTERALRPIAQIDRQKQADAFQELQRQVRGKAASVSPYRASSRLAVRRKPPCRASSNTPGCRFREPRALSARR